jgi:hypothetical protein
MKPVPAGVVVLSLIVAGVAATGVASAANVSLLNNVPLVNWDPPASLGNIKGVVVWRCDGAGANCVSADSIRSGTRDFTNHTYLDLFGGTSANTYKVTFYTTAQPPQTPDQVEGGRGYFDQVQTIGTSSSSGTILGMSSTLFYILLGALVLLLILIVILILVLRARKKRMEERPAPMEGGDAGLMGQPGPDVAGEPGAETAAGEPTGEGAMAEAWTPATEPSGAAAATAGPASQAVLQMPASGGKHYLTCPRCSTDFSASGTKPLAIQCPSCGARGVLR